MGNHEQMQRIVHELEVHQIELELQNEELKRTRSELESYLAKYTDLYEFAPVGYFTLDIDGLILQVNLTGVRMLGIERSRLINQHFSRFVVVDFRFSFAALLTKVFSSKSQETTVIRLQKGESGMCFVHVEARATEGGSECRVALIDITAQKHAEESLQESERKYRTLYETMSQGVVHQGLDGKIISANPAAQRILGLSMDEAQASPLLNHYWKAIHEDGSKFQDPSSVVLRTGKALHDAVMGAFLPKTNTYVWLNINVVPQFLPGEDKPFQVFVTLEDITDRKRMVIYNKLTSREKEIFTLLVKGLKRNIIAEILDISVKTVDKHREHLMEKLNLYEIKEVVEFARFIGLIKARYNKHNT